MMKIQTMVLVAVTVILGCEQLPDKGNEFRTAIVEKRDIIIVVESAGMIQPFRTIEVKSKASGEILSVHAETGDFVEEGKLLVQIDKRVPRNQLALAESQQEAAQARRAIAEAQFKRSERLFKSNSINEVDYEKTVLERANSRTGVVTSQVAIENARFALEDTEVDAPITGTVIEKLVEKGQVISSPTMDVGGGTVLMKMADLRKVQVQALVNEIDIGKILPGQPVSVTVTSFPDRPFRGEVLKIEPQALPEQQVTIFPVLVMLENEEGLLRPGMNADVKIMIEERRDVVAVPTAALRTTRDISTTANYLGLDELELQQALEYKERDPASIASYAESARQTNELPASGESRPDDNMAFATLDNRYWVLVSVHDGLRPVYVATGITDLEFSEVIDGLELGTEVIMLPSSGLIRTQQSMEKQFSRLTRVAGISRSED